MKNSLFVITIFLLPYLVNAQINPKTKWGDVSQAEIDYKEVSFEKNAGAVILYEAGITSVYEGKNYNRRINDRGRLLLTDILVEKKVYKRIKILNESELSMMNQQIKYISYQGTENIENIKAQTINVENGQIQITKVEKNSIKELEIDHKNKMIEIQFPNVKVGSIIEFEYVIYDKRVFYIDAWRFQHEIPTLYSELKFKYDTEAVYKGVTEGERITDLVNSRKNSQNTEWSLRNIPSTKTLKYTYNQNDSGEKIAFQLIQFSSYQFNLNFEVTTHIEGVDSWEKLGQLQSSAYKNTFHNSTSKKPIKIGDLTSLKDLTETFRKSYEWNNIYSQNADQSKEQLSQNKKGNSAELNLLLNSILNENGFDAQLVLISTRDNGKLITQYPNLEQFNSIINLITLKNNSAYLLDASNLNIDFGYMPLENFNQYGFLLDKKESTFITLMQPLSEFNSTQNYTIKNGKLILNRIDKFNGYFKSELNGFENNVTNAFKSILPNKVTGKIIQLDEKYSGIKTSISQDLSEKIYTIENPLKEILKNYIFSEIDRHQPLQFNFPYYYNVTTVTKIPEGYSLEIPSDFNFQTEFNNKDFYYEQKAELKDDNLIFTTALYLKKSIHSEFYKSIKNFFETTNHAANKTILLKKN